MNQNPGHTIKPFPLSRQIIIDSNRLGSRKHTLRGLIEFDVTEPRRILDAHREKSGERISFTAFILHCLGRAVEEHKLVQAYRKGRRHLVIFDEVDVTMVIEVELEHARFPMAHILRAVNRLSVRQLHEEIRAVQKNKYSSASMGRRKGMEWFLRLPWFLRSIVYAWIMRSPFRWREYAGTVALSAVGMYASGSSGWGMGLTNHTLGVTLGGISEKPGVVDGQIQLREILNITLDIDHDVVDGVPVAQFAQRFKQLVEEGFGLAGIDIID